MIFLSGPMVLQYPDASMDRATIQVVIKLPELGPREEMAVRAVSDLMMESTAEYSKPQIMRWGGQCGFRPTVELMPGFVQMSISVPPEQVGIGISIVDSVLRRPTFSDQALNGWKVSSQTSATDYWQTALWPQTLKVSDLRKSDLSDAFVRYFRPENVTIAIGGNFPPDSPDKLVARFEGWVMPRPVAIPLDLNRTKNALSNTTPTSTIEISGQEIRLADADFASRLLAIFALGVGKGSTLFQVPRETMGITYRQELLLWPTPKGFRTRMILATTNSEFSPTTGNEIRDTMLLSISTWTESHRSRALGAAEGLLIYGNGVSPFAITGQATIGESLERETLMRAYWFATSGKEWNPKSYFDIMKLVDLATLKESAHSLLEKSEVKVILGLGGRD